MPYKSEKIKLSETQDRRRKLTEKQKEEIRAIYATGVCGARPLAKQFGVSRKTIQVIVNPHELEDVLEDIKDCEQYIQDAHIIVCRYIDGLRR